jgi:hypothetical protein
VWNASVFRESMARRFPFGRTMLAGGGSRIPGAHVAVSGELF